MKLEDMRIGQRVIWTDPASKNGWWGCIIALDSTVKEGPIIFMADTGVRYQCLPDQCLPEELAPLTHSESTPRKYEDIGQEIGQLVDKKNAKYGDSFNRSGAILRILYPDGVAPSQYEDMLCVVRILDKLFRVATAKDGKDPGGESPYRDIAGYGLLGAERNERRSI